MRQYYQQVLMQVVRAGGDDAFMAWQMICRWEFEALMEEALGLLGPRELH